MVVPCIPPELSTPHSFLPRYCGLGQEIGMDAKFNLIIKHLFRPHMQVKKYDQSVSFFQVYFLYFVAPSTYYLRYFSTIATPMTSPLLNHELQLVGHHIPATQSSHTRYLAITYPLLSHHIPATQPPHPYYLVIAYPLLSHHIHTTQPPYPYCFATISILYLALHQYYLATASPLHSHCSVLTR